MTSTTGRSDSSLLHDKLVILLTMGVIALLFHITSANAGTPGGTAGLTTTSLDALRDTIIGYAESYGRPIGIFLVIGGAIFLLRSVGGGVIAIAAGLIAVLAVSIIYEAAVTAPVMTTLATPRAYMGPLEWALKLYGLVALRVVSAVEFWAMLPAAVGIRRFLSVRKDA